MGVSSQSGGLGGSWQRKIPLSYPDAPGIFAKTAEIKPNGAWKLTTPISFPQAIVTVTFRSPDWNYATSEDPFFLNSFSQDPVENSALLYCTQELSAGAEWISIPGAKAVYEVSGDKVTTSISRRFMVIRMVMTWHKLPYMPIGQLYNFVDVLNNDTFLGRPRGTVMMEDVKTTRERDAEGNIVQKLMVSLKTRKHDWNEVIQPDGTWDAVCFGLSGGLPDTTKKQFGYIDFKPLLFVGA